MYDITLIPKTLSEMPGFKKAFNNLYLHRQELGKPLLIFEELESENKSVFQGLSKMNYSALNSQGHLRTWLNDSGFTISV